MDSIGTQSEGGGNWAHGRGNRARTAHAVGAETSSEPDNYWTVDTGVLQVAAEPVVAEVSGSEPTGKGNGRFVFIGSYDGVHAIDDVGDEAWRFETDGMICGAPAVGRIPGGDGESGDTTVYTSCVGDTVYAVDGATGEKRWATDIEGGYSSPAVADGVVYVGSDDYSVYALDAATGEVEWSVETDGVVRSSPAVVDGVVYVGSCDGVLYAIDTADGEIVWTADVDVIAEVKTVPAVADGVLYVGANKSMHAFDAGTGEHRWQFDPSPADTVYSPAVADRMVVFGCQNTGLYCLDADSGEKQWVFAGDGAMGTPLLAGGNAVVGSADETLYAVEVDSGEESWSVDVGEAVSAGPTFVDGVYYVGGGSGTIVSFRV